MITFAINDAGDPSVGIFPMTAKVTFDDPIDYTGEDIEVMRKMLADHYDVPVSQVLTGEEYEICLKEWEKMDAEMEKIALEAAKAEEEF